MSLLFILLACFLTGFLTLLSGFGLGTLLTPFFTFIYDVKVALFLVACVHLTNNIYKLILFRKHIDSKVFRRFGLVSFMGAIIGATLFGAFSSSWIKKVFGGFLVWSGMSEFISQHGDRKIPKKWDILGGFFSGFLGGAHWGPRGHSECLSFKLLLKQRGLYCYRHRDLDPHRFDKASFIPL